MLAELTLKAFIDKVISNDPVPGGGSVSALNGALAASLAAMVANLTVGRKKYVEVNDLMQELAGRLEKTAGRLLADVDRDSDAYNRVFAAFKLPKETDEEKAARSEAIQRETKYAAEVPMEVARAVHDILPQIATARRLRQEQAKGTRFYGLRISDVKRLQWKDVFIDKGQYRLAVSMKKTKEPIYLPLSSEALKWMPERGDKTPDDTVFDLPSGNEINRLLKPWAKAAGISKRFSFHTSRHTFATMMLTLGADLYTTSKLLGHADVKMTQVYAKIINKKKDEAVNLVNGLFD